MRLDQCRLWSVIDHFCVCVCVRACVCVLVICDFFFAFFMKTREGLTWSYLDAFSWCLITSKFRWFFSRKAAWSFAFWKKKNTWLPCFIKMHLYCGGFLFDFIVFVLYLQASVGDGEKRLFSVCVRACVCVSRQMRVWTRHALKCWLEDRNPQLDTVTLHLKWTTTNRNKKKIRKGERNNVTIQHDVSKQANYEGKSPLGQDGICKTTEKEVCSFCLLWSQSTLAGRTWRAAGAAGTQALHNYASLKVGQCCPSPITLSVRGWFHSDWP